MTETVTPEELAIGKMKDTLRKIRDIFGSTCHNHSFGCASWSVGGKYKPEFSSINCDCAIGDVLHQIGMLEDFLKQ